MAGVLTMLAPPRRARFFIFLGILCLLSSIGLAALHSGVEHKLWPSPFPQCRAPVFHGGSFSDWMANMPARPAKPCDAPDYLFHLPISMTETGGVYAFAVLIATLYGLRRMGRRRS